MNTFSPTVQPGPISPDPTHGLIDAPAPISLDSSRPRRLESARTATVELPERFDVHRIDEIVAMVDEARSGGQDVLVDGQRVEMIDLAALDALDGLVDDRTVRLRRPSVALAMTIRYAGQGLGLDVPTVPTLANVA